MVHLQLLLTALVFCLHPACSPGSPVPWSPDPELQHILQLLQQLQMIPSYQCLDDRENFTFTIQKTEATSVKRLMLQQIFNIFTRDHPPARDGQVLNELRSRLHQGLQRLQMAREQNVSCLKAELSVRNYFKSLLSYLQRKRYSPCAWEIVRAEIHRSLSRISQWHTEVSN
ncbi:interferon alpha-2-like [Perognathus longimembris pacificus]|uniref:interferon alpha-2-like n=1 Tax=Perognathus longimembris pacificus TaxID=214514 RepID=UPI002019AAC5|nr:interferon alpha-2-like [Perognathus longimembris pacificus]